MNTMLKKQFHKLGISAKQLVNELIAYKFKASSSAAYAFLSKKRFKPFEALFLSTKLSLPIEEFGYSSAQFQPIGNTSDIQQSNIEFECFDEKLDKDYEAFIEKYFSLLQSKIEQATEQISIYDYFAINKGVKNAPYRRLFTEAMEKYYLSIEAQLKAHPQMRYRRFLVLPLETYKGRQISKEEALKKAIVLAFSVTLEHIMRSFKFGDRFELYLLPVPVRLFSFGTIDNDISLAEYDKLSAFGQVSSPSKLFINQGKDLKTQGIIQSYQREIDELALNSAIDGLSYCYRLESIDFASAVKRGIEEASSTLKRINDQISDSAEMFQVEPSFDIEIIARKKIENQIILNALEKKRETMKKAVATA